jgi:peptidoglycan hydrolase-like protein with peptidoglycan-binding domain
VVQLFAVILDRSKNASDLPPRADEPAAHGNRSCVFAVVLALMLGCGGLGTRPTVGPAAETKSTATTDHVDRDLMQVQRRLKELGHDPGPIDGQLGPKTQAALKAFQTDYGLVATGDIDAETRAALGLGRKVSP